ncbi:MAG: glycosyltransferase, partial [Planctomycetota bacterium]
MTTYNQPESLAKSLLSFSLQTDGDFDVLVADDGSDRRTAEVIERFSNSLMIRHVWHPDTGFAKCEILNKAIAVSDHDYLIFTDGDCIVARDFVAIHRRHARPGHFLSGTYNNLPASFGDIVSEHAITSGDAFELAWLRGRGLPKSRMDWRMHRSQILKRVLNATTTTRPNWNGCNVSGWRRDLIAANGFDERMGHGGLDRELGYRLNHAGIRGSHVRFLAICLHCDHQRGYADPETLENNRSILATTRRNR